MNVRWGVHGKSYRLDWHITTQAAVAKPGRDYRLIEIHLALIDNTRWWSFDVERPWFSVQCTLIMTIVAYGKLKISMKYYYRSQVNETDRSILANHRRKDVTFVTCWTFCISRLRVMNVYMFSMTSRRVCIIAWCRTTHLSFIHSLIHSLNNKGPTGLWQVLLQFNVMQWKSHLLQKYSVVNIRLLKMQ